MVHIAKVLLKHQESCCMCVMKIYSIHSLATV